MKIRYGETRDYQKNRVAKIMRNKSRRKDYKSRFANSNNRVNQNPNKPDYPPVLLLLSGNVKNFKRTVIEAPNIFSFTNNPEETIGFISLVSSCFACKDDVLDLKINFDKCTKIDIGALSVLDIAISKGLKYFDTTKRQCNISGLSPVNVEASIIFNYSGLPKVFGNDNIHPSLVVLDPLESKDDASVEANRIINYYNTCLQKCGYTLNEKGISFFGTLIGEIVDNSIIHCGKYGPLNFSGGFYNSNESKGQLSIVSLGNTLYDSLNSNSTNEKIKNDILSIIDKHDNSDFGKETIWTICALQEGVSCKRNDDDLDRGTGTVKFIEAFLEVGQTTKDKTKPIMSIVSGKTQLLFDGKYKLEKNSSGNKKIAFNDDNDLTKDPDHNYVKEMNYKFPGVIINIEFYLDKNHLKKYERKD